MGKLSVFILLLVLGNLSWADVTTTSSPSQDSTVQTVANDNENKLQSTESLVSDQTEEPVTDNETGSGDNAEDQTEAAEKVEQTTVSNEAETTVDVQEISKEVTTKSAKPSRACSEPGLQVGDKNCRIYHECVAAKDGSLQLQTKSCPARQAYNSVLQRCSRDESDCELKVRCFSKGVVADPSSNSSYYLCQPRFTGYGYHIFHVYCGASEVYNPLYGVCLRDPSSSSVTGSIVNGGIGDALVVRQEIKELKKEYKQAIKAEEEKIKAEKKAQKQQEKEAEKLEKQQEKLQKQKRQQEAASYPCQTEGNFPSEVADNFYVACVYNKKKVIALPMECSEGAKFNKQSGSCVKSTEGEN